MWMGQPLFVPRPQVSPLRNHRGLQFLDAEGAHHAACCRAPPYKSQGALQAATYAEGVLFDKPQDAIHIANGSVIRVKGVWRETSMQVMSFQCFGTVGL